MRPDEARLLVQALDDRPRLRPRVQPARVVATNYGDGTLSVHMDGDPDDAFVEVNVLDHNPVVNDRVMVLFDPPRGVYVIGRIAAPSTTGEVIFYREIVENAYLYDFDIDRQYLLFSENVEFQVGRRYSVDFSAHLYTYTAYASVGTSVRADNTRLQLAFWDSTNADAFSITLTRAALFVPTKPVYDIRFYFSVSAAADGGLYASETQPSYVKITDVGPAPDGTL